MSAFQPKMYSWKDVTYSVPAQVVGETCERIEEECGEVTRQTFLDASRDEESPTHKLFEWKDDVAAENWRLVQAGKILHSLKITIIKPDETEMLQRAFVNVKSADSEGSYRSFEVAMSDVDMRSEILKRALRELRIFKEKYAEISELAVVFDAIKIVTKKMEETE